MGLKKYADINQALGSMKQGEFKNVRIGNQGIVTLRKGQGREQVPVEPRIFPTERFYTPKKRAKAIISDKLK